MPAWKVSDEQTASELLSRIGQDTSVYIDSSSPALDGSDAVILAPTAYKGVTMLITARRRNSTSTYEPAAVLDSPPTIPEETLAPEPIDTRLPDETASAEAPNIVEDRPSELEPTSTTDAFFTGSPAPLYDEPTLSSETDTDSASAMEETTEEDFFGPTTWERIENAEIELPPLVSPETSRAEREQEVAPAPDLTGIPSLPEPVTNVPYVNSKATEELPSAPPAPKPAPERQYIATGFLGLDETVEDDEDRAREKRPWWKKLFID